MRWRVIRMVPIQGWWAPLRLTGRRAIPAEIQDTAKIRFLLVAAAAASLVNAALLAAPATPVHAESICALDSERPKPALLPTTRMRISELDTDDVRENNRGSALWSE